MLNIARARRSTKHKEVHSSSNGWTISIIRFERAAGIDHIMHSASFSFNLWNGRQKGQGRSVHWFVLRWCCWAAKSLTHSSAFFSRTRQTEIFRFTSLPTPETSQVKPMAGTFELNSFQSVLAESQQHHGLRDAIPMLFDLLRLQRLPFSCIEIKMDVLIQK